MSPVLDMKYTSSFEVYHLLPTTVLPLPYHPEQGAAGLRPRYSRAIHMFEVGVEVVIIPTPNKSQTNVRNVVKICNQAI